MIDPLTFFKGLGIMIVIIILFLGFLYWVVVITRKFAPDFKYWLKYKVFRKKYQEKHIEKLLQYYDAKMSNEDVLKLLLLNNWPLDVAKEMLWIYKELTKLKGGSLK